MSAEQKHRQKLLSFYWHPPEDCVGSAGCTLLSGFRARKVYRIGARQLFRGNARGSRNPTFRNTSTTSEGERKFSTLRIRYRKRVESPVSRAEIGRTTPYPRTVQYRRGSHFLSTEYSCTQRVPPGFRTRYSPRRQAS